MRISIKSGAFTTFLGLAGGGAALAMPDARWLGYSLIAVAAIVFAFDIRVEKSEVKAGPRRMWLFYILAGSALVFVLALLGIVLQYDPLDKASSNKRKDHAKIAQENLPIDDLGRPTLFDLFMSDFSGKSLMATLSYPKEMVFLDGKQERFYVNHYYEYDNNTNFRHGAANP